MSIKLRVDRKWKSFLVVTHRAIEAATKSYGVFISKNDNKFIKLDSV